MTPVTKQRGRQHERSPLEVQWRLLARSLLWLAKFAVRSLIAAYERAAFSPT